MVDGVEELGQINVHCDAFAVLHVSLHLPDRLVCIAAWSDCLVCKPKLDSENVGSNIGVSTWATACWMTRSMTVGMPSWRLPPPGLGISTLRAFVGLYPFPCLRQVVAGQYFGKQFGYHLSTSSCFKARCVLAAADFCSITAYIAASRAVRLDDVAASFFDTQRAARYGAWVLVFRWNPSGYRRHPVAPHAVQISPGKGRELSVHKRRIYRRCRTGGLCCHVPACLGFSGP
jgi:hypothetical protein